MDNNNLDELKAQYGHPEPQKPKKNWRPIVLSIAIVIVVAGIALGILEVIKHNSDTTKTTTTTQTPTVITGGPTAKDVIDKVAANPTIVGLKNYTLFRADPAQAGVSPDTTTVLSSQTGYSFVTNTTPDDSLQFTLTDVNGASSKDAITSAIKQTLTDNGFSQTTQDVSSLSVYTTTTYRNKGTVCQIVDFANGKLAGQEQSLLCASGATIAASYATVHDQLTKADASLLTSSKSVIQTLITSENKKLLILTVTPKDSTAASNYYFATLDTSYDYIGTKLVPSVDNANSYAIPDSLKKNIADPKWGTFLSDNIQ